MKTNATIKGLEFNSKEAVDLLDKYSEFIYTTHFWVGFLKTDLSYEPVVSEIAIENNAVYFVGLIFKILYKKQAHFFGNASYREHQLLRPNEYLV